MTIRTISYSPIRVTIDDVEVPVIEESYQDEDDQPQKVSYILVNGEKFPIQHRVEIMGKLVGESLDSVLVKIAIARDEKLNQK